MSKFNTISPRKTRKTTNVADGVAYTMGSKMELVFAVLTTFLEDKFYEKGEDRQGRICQLVRQNSPQFVANLAIVARREFNLRSVSHLLIGELAKTHNGDSLVKDTIIACANRPDDLTELVAYVGTPLPKQVKRGCRNALLKFNRYSLAKYRGEGKGVSLVDLFNLVHPKVQHADKEQKKAWKDLMEGNLASFDTWEVEISKPGTEKEKKKRWEKLILEDKMGYMALLRNLNNFIKYDISAKALDKVVEILTDQDRIESSMVLPFRFWTAYNSVSGNGNRKLLGAVAKAMEGAVSNVPLLKGRTLVAVDSSGSMEMGEDPAMPKAAIFAAALWKANPDSEIILYDTSVYQTRINDFTPIIDIAKKLIDEANGGGTETSLVFQYAREQKKAFDRVIIISDNASWQESRYDSSVQAEYERYKRDTGTDPFVYAIDIQGYGTKDLTGGKVFHLCGWSERLLDFVGQAERGDSIVKYIEEYVPKEFRKKKRD